MRDICAGREGEGREEICSWEADQTAQSDTTVETVQLVTALDEPAYRNVGKAHFRSRDGRKLQVQHEEGDVSFPTVSVGEASQQSSWFAGCQAMLPGSSGKHQKTREVDSNAIKLGCQAW